MTLRPLRIVSPPRPAPAPEGNAAVLAGLAALTAEVEALRLALAETAAPAPQREIMSRREAADWLGVSTPTLDRLTRMGEIPVTRVGDSPRYVRADVLAWLRARSAEVARAAQ